jgi:hypothetical protein
MRKLLIPMAVCVVSLFAVLDSTVAKDFRSDPAPPAESTCPGDRVVWVNTRSNIYHFAGQTWFGHTSQGKYLCRRAADAEGDRPTHNGQ